MIQVASLPTNTALLPFPVTSGMVVPLSWLQVQIKRHWSKRLAEDGVGRGVDAATGAGIVAGAVVDDEAAGVLFEFL